MIVLLRFAVLSGLAIFVTLYILRSLQNNQLQRQLDDAFYRLLETQEGRISLIQLAMAARVDAELAKGYLDEQIRTFAATAEVDRDGDTFYRFPKLRLDRQWQIYRDLES